MHLFSWLHKRLTGRPMRLATWRRSWYSISAVGSKARQRRRRARFGVLQLETRLTPSLTTLGTFGFPAGQNPYAGLVMDSSGNLYGTAYSGGTYNDGAVFELAKGTGALTPLASFNGTDGRNPYAGLIMDGSGNLYGTTYGGGASNNGTVFELAQGSGTITTLASFNGADGANPYAGLIRDGGGNLYGTTYGGGASNEGTVFELAQGSSTISTLASFNGTDGKNPYAGLVLDSSGNLYGTTFGGGASNDGTVFELAQGSGTITTLATFSGTDGVDPYASLIRDSSSNLYGTTTGGGASNDGTVFELAQGSGTITRLASFNGTNGAKPEGALIMDGSGNLYGTTAGMRGVSATVFELAKGSGTITTVASLGLIFPAAGLVMDDSGNLYCTSVEGGPSNDGTVFELAKGSATITTLASFIAPNGTHPYGGLIRDSSGNLYGTTNSGGASNWGTVFELVHGSGSLTTLASFDGADGATPYGGLTMDSSGNLYGTTLHGGATGSGTVFELANDSGTITTLASFNGTSGYDPYAGVIMDGSGNLYGTTNLGGAYGYGTVFELTKGTGTLSPLASFNGTDGASSYAALVLDSSGNLYGTTSQGGPTWNPSAGVFGDGTVFELTRGSGTITALATFNGTDGDFPQAALTLDSSGNLYGTAFYGGPDWNPSAGVYGDGTVFELAQGTGTITVLASFNGADGQGPDAGLIQDSIGNLYGTTDWGGASSGEGTVFELAAGSGTIITLATFNGSNGSNLQGLVMDSSGNLYSTTAFGGPSDNGTLFELSGAVVADQWTGANFAVDTNWSDGANWSLGAPPAPGQTVLFTRNASVKHFTSTVDAGFANPLGALHIDGTWGGTITVNSPLGVAGNLTLASGTFGGTGPVSIGGSASQWTGGKIVVGTNGFSNSGTLTVDTTGGNLFLTGAGTLTNNGTLIEAGTNSLVLKYGATLNNAAGATFDLAADAGVSQLGGGKFTNAGTLEKTGGTGTSIIATTSLSNTGTVDVATGTLDIAAVVRQISGTTLKGGAWTVTGSSTLSANLDITSAGSLTTLGAGTTVTLNGLNTSFTNLSGLSTIAAGASLSMVGGQSFTTTGALTNKGSLVLGAGSVLTVSGSFTQTSTGTLTVELGGTATAPTFAQLVSTTGKVALAGHLDVLSGVVPAVGSAFELLDNEGNTAVTGIFAGLAPGSTFTVTLGGTTMTFKIAYAGTDADGKHNVVITRIA